MIEISNKTRSKINLSLVEKTAERILHKFRHQSDYVSIVFIGDILMRRFNKQFRGKDKPTDVLSFRAADAEIQEPGVLGEIFVDWQQIKRQALKMGHSKQYELAFIVAHGILHLLGYNDDTDIESKKMLLLGEKLLKDLEII